MVRRLAFVVGALAVMTLALAQPVVRRIDNARLKPGIQLNDTFKNVLAEHRVPQDKQVAALKQFQGLDPDLQHTLLTAMDQDYAVAHDIPAKSTMVYRFNRDIFIRPVLLKPSVSAVWPASGGVPNQYFVVFGGPVHAGSKILWDNVEQPTTYFGPDVPWFPNTVCARVPSTTALGMTHGVKIRNGAAESDGFIYRACAERGYRGLHGWKFANFGDPTIPWAQYRDFFGAAAVEYGSGTHRPSAQAWYDSAYKGVGGGGNCYGMSNSSLRIRNGNMTTAHHGWFTSNPQSFCWLYPWQTETKQTVQEDQGGQLSAEMNATINDYWNHQDHKAAWNRINSLATESSNRPVVCFWYTGHWGHAVVGYDTAIAGAQRKIIWYDNNEPYAENETGGPDKSSAYVDWNNSSFHANSYGTANKMVCLSYNECMRAPHLPTEAGGPGAGTTGTVVAVVEGGQVQQIEDENGRRFIAANGQDNEDPNTRIPESMRYIPAQTAGQDYVGPAIFIFSKAPSKSLTFTVAGGGMKRLSFFQAGNVFRADFAGQGQLRFSRILTPTRALELPNPQLLQPSLLRLLLVRPDERVFDLQSLNLGATPAVAMLTPNGDGLDLQTGGAARFDLQTETFVNGQLSQALFRNVATQAAGRAVLQPQDWNNLRATSLNLNLRGLNNQQLQQLRLNQ